MRRLPTGLAPANETFNVVKVAKIFEVIGFQCYASLHAKHHVVSITKNAFIETTSLKTTQTICSERKMSSFLNKNKMSYTLLSKLRMRIEKFFPSRKAVFVAAKQQIGKSHSQNSQVEIFRYIDGEAI